MTKADIALAVSQKLGFSKTQCAALVDRVFEMMKESLEKGEEVKLSSLGRFTVRCKQTRRGRNPQTGEQLEITARKVVTFKSSPVLRSRMGG
ncbi:MAG: integration host factor subunit alpha [Myxococcaceae bacterium]|nr:integration host factor subunit alpha [Myxococcaceae bacterium]MBH2005758.1 integration host factor subunit alpha [Myxococcaceae bacterium]